MGHEEGLSNIRDERNLINNEIEQDNTIPSEWDMSDVDEFSPDGIFDKADLSAEQPKAVEGDLSPFGIFYDEDPSASYFKNDKADLSAEKPAEPDDASQEAQQKKAELIRAVMSEAFEKFDKNFATISELKRDISKRTNAAELILEHPHRGDEEELLHHARNLEDLGAQIDLILKRTDRDCEELFRMAQENRDTIGEEEYSRCVREIQRFGEMIEEMKDEPKTIIEQSKKYDSIAKSMMR